MLSTRQLHLNNSEISSNLSEQYAPVSSKLFLQPFLDKGWKPVKNINNKKKEWITLEHDDYKFLNDDTVRLEMINSYDGSCALNIMGGIGRLVCSNGLVIGRDFEKFRFVHRGTKIYDRLEESYGLITAKLNKIKSDVYKLQALQLDRDKANEVITNIYKEVLERDTDKFKTTLSKVYPYILERTQKPRRKEDFGRDAFTLMNVVQERIVRMGTFGAEVSEMDKVENKTMTKYISKRGSENKFSSLKLNESISSQFLALVN